MAEILPIIAPGLVAPTGPFPHATRIGHRVYTSGQAGRNRDTGQMGDAAEQVDGALRNIAVVAEAAGTAIEHTLKVTLILRDDVTDMAAVNEAYARHFPDRQPARTSFFVSRLKNPDMLVEVEAVIGVV
ncbi:MAG TPA: RidA family protein [Ilumatobacteraceae bacterium]|nr:RidA family protein [Ilumatobacteraceae bacterium]